jgi:3-deoxy-7-phosphoheptulonate synthase
MNQPLSLAQLRAEIDSIDDQILALIERRFEAAAAVARAKARAEPGRLKLRPRRQAAVIARLQSRARSAAPEAVGAVWRELMGHALQAQARTELVLCGPGPHGLLEARVRAHFGSAAPLSWADSPDDALRRAREEEAVAIVSGPLPADASGLTPFEVIQDEGGRTLAYALGRVAPSDALPEARSGWDPQSWRARKAMQMPVWPDAAALADVERSLAAQPPLVPLGEAMALRADLARVADGRAFLLQGGDCAESFAEFSPEKVRRDERLILAMGSLIASAAGDTVHVARAAGQFAKPRSAALETSGRATLPSYRGDAVNGRAFAASARTPAADRLLDAHAQARATLGLLAAFGDSEPGRPRVYASHEALLLNYEQALTRRDPETGRWWAGSGHMLWIGDRTRGLDGAHVEYARGIANPIGLKCGPGLGPDELLRLIDRLDPANEAGRLVLVGRFGVEAIGACLPPLMRAVKVEGRRAIWTIDPMHGNGLALGPVKTRRVQDIVAELAAFFDIAAAERVHAGGIHLEMTGSDVTECLGGGVGEADLTRRYLSHCDPRLNPAQALAVAAEAVRLIRRRQLRSNAA